MRKNWCHISLFDALLSVERETRMDPQMKKMKMTRREFARNILMMAAAVGALNAEAGVKGSLQKRKSYSFINVDKKVCGTCQHWRGERIVVDRGRRVKCQQSAEAPCFRGPGFKYPATSPAASHGCVRGGQYKRWVGLP